MTEKKPIVYQKLKDVPEVVVSEGNMLWNRTGTWRYLRPRYLNMTPPCNQGCPAGNDVEGFISLIDQGKYVEAWKLLKEENPFPKVCGRVCYHPCETVCNRSEFDDSIAINALERFAADFVPQNLKPEKIKPDTGKTVVIIGSGPAGLAAAYHLARMGHAVTVFEADEAPGGLMRYGIPEYRLPNAVLDSEIDDIKALGVKIICNHKIKKESDWKELKAFNAVFIGTGVHGNNQLGINNENTKGVYPGLEFLGAVIRGKPPGLGKQTVVIGGGNSAIDSARCALRLGSQVSLYYHRSRKEMPAFEEEIYEAEREGLKVHFLRQPVEILASNGKVTGIRLRQTMLGEPDKSGRRRPEPVPGTEFDLEVDSIITAIGESAELDFLPPEVQTERGRINVDELGLTSHPGVFAGGDAALSTHNVAVAIGSGKAAACAIDTWLKEEKPNDLKERIMIGQTGAVSVARYLKTGNAHSSNTDTKHVVAFKEINTNYFETVARHKMRKLSMEERSSDFSEISLGFTQDAAVNEASRCFHCGVCTMCDNCYVFCPDVSISRKQVDDRGYEIAMDYCKGCGICVNECPRSAMIMEEEQ